MRHLDLFSGIGGFALAAQWTWGEQYEPVAFCEIDEYCRKVLNKHWPDVPIHKDITKLDGKQYEGTIELITGGFPCQDISIAGNGAGLAGAKSGLWWEMHRIISEVRPRFAIVENSPELLNRGFASLLGSLAAFGYNAEWHCIPASRIGALHNRDRVWIIAYPKTLGRIRGRKYKPKKIYGKFARLDCKKTWQENLSTPEFCRASDGIPNRVDRVSAGGNAIVPQVAAVIMQAIKLTEE